MDFKLNREIFTATETQQDTSFEQSVEQDLLLPDYYPDIFRVLKCRLMPRIVSHSINGDKLTYELVALVKIIYLSEDSDKVNCVEQKLTYTKSCDIPQGIKNPCVVLTPKTDYINCRVVNQRRLDLRGAVTVRVKLTSEKARAVVSDAQGGNIQLLHEPVTFPTGRLYASKRVTIVEELELGDTKKPVSSIIRNGCAITLSEQKIVSGRLVVKGECDVNVLYGSDSDDGMSLETMRFSVPFSQIIDMEGIDEKYELFCDVMSSGCDIIVKGESMKTLECEIVMLVNCRAVRYETCDLVTDAYSTSNICEPEISDEKLEAVPVRISEPHTQTATLTCHDGEIGSVCDVWCDLSGVSGRYSFDKNGIIISGNITFSAMCRNDSGCPTYLETDSAFEHKVESECVSEDSFVEPCVSVVGCSYTLVGSNAVEIKAELNIGGYVCKLITKKLVTGITLSEEACDKSDLGALTLYYAGCGEKVWDIAKRYSVPVGAVMSENDLASDVLSDDKMLLVPDIDN